MGERQAEFMKIGQLAKRLGLNVRTLRYYESIGLLPSPTRTEGGFRLYTEEDEQNLRFVLQAKSAGFSLEEIREIIRLSRDGSACSYVREHLAQHIAAVDAQIAELTRLRADLAQVVGAWEEIPSVPAGRICGLIEHGLSTAPSDMRKESLMPQQHSSCINACIQCAKECEACTICCLGDRPDCARLCIDCGAICWLAASLMSRVSQFSTAICRVCAEACDACAAECEKYPDMEQCRRCAEACRRCAEECRQMAGA